MRPKLWQNGSPVKRVLGLFSILAALVCAGHAQAFQHVVQKGDTLASLAEKYYGRIQLEKLLVAANLLDMGGGSPIVHGMRLEVPALGHFRVRPGDNWDLLAAELLGSPSRSDVLSIANDSSPWLTPQEGSEIIVPYNLRLIAEQGDNLIEYAYTYLGDKNKAWVLDRYNGFKGKGIGPGDVVLIPLTDLPLTEAGKKAARLAAGVAYTEGAGETRLAQRKVAQEIPALIADVRAGRFVDAVSRGNRFVGSATLSEPQLAVIYRELTTAYAALDAHGLATTACQEWRKRDAAARLDPVILSPKIIRVCERAKP
ncbi:MAG TPA: LysM domain-containing protein [Polyangiaceae bacterium]|nr:LysM domain-containing protein [Polyangiaceae bacterium]